MKKDAWMVNRSFPVFDLYVPDQGEETEQVIQHSTKKQL